MRATLRPAAGRGPLATLAAVALLLIAGLTVSWQAGANHISGAVYTGTHAGGGTLEFTVAADGSKLTNLKLTPPLPPCGAGNMEYMDSAFAPNSIVNHSFSYTGPTKLGTGLSFSGSFGSVQGASGTLQFTRTTPSCSTPTYTWSATTTAAPPPTPSPGPGGPGRCVVPKVKGKRVPAAKRAIVNRGCRVGTIGRAFSGRVARGRIISQRPRPGAQRPKGAKVNFVVSKGARRR